MAMASTVQIMAKRIPLIKFPTRPRLGTPAATAAGPTTSATKAEVKKISSAATEGATASSQSSPSKV